VRFEFTDRQPPAFWNQVQAHEYGWFSNVMPSVPHRRWSQEWERMLGTGEQKATLPYNGYGAWVAQLYPERQTVIT